mgnify:CR=1 FL=1
MVRRAHAQEIPAPEMAENVVPEPVVAKLNGFVEEEVDLAEVAFEKDSEPMAVVDDTAPIEEEVVNWLEEYIKLSAEDPNAPTRDHIHALKNKYGSIYFIRMNKTMFYLYRPVNGEEYAEIFKLMLQNTKDEDVRTQERFLNELLVYKCVVYPKISPTNKGRLPAGIIPSLSHLIHVVSMFADPQTLSMSVFEL